MVQIRKRSADVTFRSCSAVSADDGVDGMLELPDDDGRELSQVLRQNKAFNEAPIFELDMTQMTYRCDSK